jgi:hypothetical protein
MTDHDMIVLIAVGGFALQIAGLVVLGLQLLQARRESRRLTTAPAGLAVQEAERIRALVQEIRRLAGG